MNLYLSQGHIYTNSQQHLACLPHGYKKNIKQICLDIHK